MIKLTEKGGFRREPWFPFQLDKTPSKTDFSKKKDGWETLVS